MKIGYAPAAIVCAFLLTSCGGKDLSKEQARSLIAENLEKKPTTEPLLTGMDNIGANSEADYFASPGGKYQKALEADGMITIKSKGKIYNPANKAEWFNSLDIALTDKAKPFVTGKPNIVPAISPNTWPTVYENVAFCGKEVVDVSLPNINDDFARADYTWHAAKLTIFAVDSQKADPSAKTECNPAQVQNASATFELKDNVWKLATAQ